jgi:hypothetical protein
MYWYRSRAITSIAPGGQRVRWRQWRSHQWSAASLLIMSAVLVGCGFTDHHINGMRTISTHAVSTAEIVRGTGENTHEELVQLAHKSPVLARIGLPGGGVSNIVAMQCAAHTTSCYELGRYGEEPARYGTRRHRKMRGMVSSGVSTGPAISDAGPAERMVLDLFVDHECGGPYPYRLPYALAYGLLRGAKDVVTDQVGGRTIRMKTAGIPSRMHPEGVLVYGLLRPGSNDIVVRTSNGRIVSRQRWSGANEEVSCHHQ